jgi:hypothetical protein
LEIFSFFLSFLLCTDLEPWFSHLLFSLSWDCRHHHHVRSMLVIFSLFYISHSYCSEVLYHSGLFCILLMISDIERFFIYLLNSISSFEKCIF